MCNTNTTPKLNWLISITMMSGHEINFHQFNKSENEIKDFVLFLWKDARASNNVSFYDEKYQHAGYIRGQEIAAITYVKFD